MSADHKRKQILGSSSKEHRKYITVNTPSESSQEFLYCEVTKANRFQYVYTLYHSTGGIYAHNYTVL